MLLVAASLRGASAELADSGKNPPEGSAPIHAE
jgi:hypothetical protein